jgi:hypothetical protein
MCEADSYLNSPDLLGFSPLQLPRFAEGVEMGVCLLGTSIPQGCGQ